MSKAELPSFVDRLARRHPRLLVTTNVVLLIFLTLYLLTVTEAPVVLYQAF